MVNFFIVLFNILKDDDKIFHAQNWQFGFNEPATVTMLGLVDLHHTIMFYLIIVFCVVTTLLFAVIYGYDQQPGAEHSEQVANFEHDPFLETLWTLFPSFIIVLIMIPSISLLYSADELKDPSVTFKVIGHQWYWSYEYSDYVDPEFHNPLVFDSNLIDSKTSLLEVDNHVVLPVNTVVRAMITSEDVIHSWAVPSFGIKMDAIPGRLNQVLFSVHRTGHYFGQCSELCGVGHGFMPIHVEVTTLPDYLAWVVLSYINDKSLKWPYSPHGFLEMVYIYGSANKCSREELAEFIRGWLHAEYYGTFPEFIDFLKSTYFKKYL